MEGAQKKIINEKICHDFIAQQTFEVVPQMWF